jgi:hypothetical protein
MNAVEIEEAISTLAEAPFSAETFPYGIWHWLHPAFISIGWVRYAEN